MQSFVTIAGVNEALTNLVLKPDTLKARLVLAMQEFFNSQESLANIAVIAPEELVRKIWQTDDPKEIQQKRKSLSGLKSSLNKALKELAKKGKNPEGIILNRDNVFEVSEEQKNAILAKLGLTSGAGAEMAELFDSFKKAFPELAAEQGIAGLSQLFEELQQAQQSIARLQGQMAEQQEQLSALNEQLLAAHTALAAADQQAETAELAAAAALQNAEQARQQAEEAQAALAALQEKAGGLLDDDVEIVAIDDIEEQPEEELEEFDIDADEYEELEIDEELAELAEEDLPALAVDDELLEVDEEELKELDRDAELTELAEEDLPALAGDDELLEVDEEELEELAHDADITELAEEDLPALAGDDELLEVDEEELEELDRDADITGLVEEDLPALTGDDELLEVDEEELEELDLDTELTELAEEELPALTGDDELLEVNEEELEELARDADFAELAEEDLPALAVDDELLEVDEEELEELEIDEEQLEELAHDADFTELAEEDLPALAVDDELLEVDEKIYETGELEEISETELDELELADDSAADNKEIAERPAKLLEVLSKYLDPAEALQSGVLAESEEGIVNQLLERFTPKFIRIPAGLYTIGSRQPDRHELPLQTVTLKNLYIGQVPVTNDLFELFVRETGYETDAERSGFGRVHQGRCVSSKDSATGRATFTISKGSTVNTVPGANWRHPAGPGSSIEHKNSHPVVQVSRKDANAFAAWAGKRLPTEEEWEAAAKGDKACSFPWGEQWNAANGNFSSSYAGDTSPVERYKDKNVSPFGIFDLLGNVYEWTSTIGHTAAASNGLKRHLYVLKGGCWNSQTVISSAHRLLEEDTWSNIIGFRCAV